MGPIGAPVEPEDLKVREVYHMWGQRGKVDAYVQVLKVEFDNIKVNNDCNVSLFSANKWNNSYLYGSCWMYPCFVQFYKVPEILKPLIKIELRQLRRHITNRVR